MKVLVLALFVAVVTGAPVPEEGGIDGVELIVNGVPEGAALEVSDIVGIKLKEHVDGVVVAATDILHPYTAVGIAEAEAAAAAADQIAPEPVILPLPTLPQVVPEPVVMPSPIVPVPEVMVPQPVVMPAPAAPEVVVPEPVVMPAPAAPEVVVPEPVVMPAPAVSEVVVPEPVVMPAPAVPEVVVPEPVVMPAPAVSEVVVANDLPVPAPQFNGDLFNDGNVQVQYNGPDPNEPGVFTALQSWFNLVINYFNQ